MESQVSNNKKQVINTTNFPVKLQYESIQYLAYGRLHFFYECILIL